MTMLGFEKSFPASFLAIFHLLFAARTASIMASDDPIVETPIASLFSSLRGAFQSRAMWLTQRDSSSAIAGYSSWSIMFFDRFSTINFSASGSIKVV